MDGFVERAALLGADVVGQLDPERTADLLLVLRDGLVVGFDLDDPAAVRATAQEALARLVGPDAGLDVSGPVAAPPTRRAPAHTE
ncbi:hypothetical protein AB0K67_13225 [Nonomuraea sp. NPDC052634]|uniref:hypothetical protein n=1 Tax=Nonomuraea sp. NPDC052634 TaxID=3155813 RepID=UPI00344317A0